MIMMGSQVNEVASTGDVSPGEDENTKIADLAAKAQEAAQQIPSGRTAPSPQVADAAPTGKKLKIYTWTHTYTYTI